MSIKVNIGGEIFETTVSTLKKINYFKYILEDTNYDNTQIIFVDRSKHIFKHVLALAIDETYGYPLKYKNELDFYDVVYDVNKLREPLEDINNKINILDNKINTLSERVDIITPKKCKVGNCGRKVKHNDIFLCGSHMVWNNRCLHFITELTYSRICGTYCDNLKGEYYCKDH